FVQVPERVDLVLGREVNPVHLVDHIPQQIPVYHPVNGALENAGDHVAPVAIDALERTQIGEESNAARTVRAGCLILIDEGYELRAGDPFVLCCPITPAIRRLDAWTESFAGEIRLLLPNLFHVVQELEEHNPGEHRQAVDVAVEAFVLPHDVTARFDDRAELL